MCPINFPHPLVPLTLPYAFIKPVFCLLPNHSMGAWSLISRITEWRRRPSHVIHQPWDTLCMLGEDPLYDHPIFYASIGSMSSVLVSTPQLVYPCTCYPPRNISCCLHYFSSLWPSARVLMTYNRNFSYIFRPRVWHDGLELIGSCEGVLADSRWPTWLNEGERTLSYEN